MMSLEKGDIINIKGTDIVGVVNRNLAEGVEVTICFDKERFINKKVLLSENEIQITEIDANDKRLGFIEYMRDTVSVKSLFSGKMRNPNRMELFMDKFMELWKSQPDIRFGQLISNLMMADEDKLFGMEDDEMLKRIQESIDNRAR